MDLMDEVNAVIRVALADAAGAPIRVSCYHDRQVRLFRFQIFFTDGLLERYSEFCLYDLDLVVDGGIRLLDLKLRQAIAMLTERPSYNCRCLAVPVDGPKTVATFEPPVADHSEVDALLDRLNSDLSKTDSAAQFDAEGKFRLN
jgi:hypothetical protein